MFPAGEFNRRNHFPGTALDKCCCRIILFHQLLGSNFRYLDGTRRLNHELYSSTILLRSAAAAGSGDHSLPGGRGATAEKTGRPSGKQRLRSGRGEALSRAEAYPERLSASGDALSRRGGGTALLGFAAGSLRASRQGSHGALRRFQKHAGNRHRAVTTGACEISTPAAGGSRSRGPIRPGRVRRNRLSRLPAHLGSAGVQSIY